MSGISNLPCGGSKLETNDFIIYSMIASGDKSGLPTFQEYTVKQNISRIILNIGGMFIDVYRASESWDTTIGGTITLYDKNNGRIAYYDRRKTITYREQLNSGFPIVYNETYEINKYVEKIMLSPATFSSGTTACSNASYVSITLIKQK